MTETLQIIAKHIVDGKVIEEIIVFDKNVDKVRSIEELGFNHKEQIDLVSECQNACDVSVSRKSENDLSA